MEQANIINYKCPNCAAPLTYEIKSGGWECHFCDSFFSKEEMEKLEALEGTEQTEQNYWTAELFDEQDLIAYTCPDCGGRVLAEKHTAASFCTYCHHPNVLASQLKGEYKPAKILPFKVPKEVVIADLKKILKNKPLLPKFFRDCVDKGEVTGLYVPFWLFSSDVDFDMSGQGTRTQVWSDSKYDYIKTDLYHVRRQGSADIRLVPIGGSSRMDSTLMDSIEPFHYNELTDFSMQYLSGHFAETYDIDAAQSYNKFASRTNKATQEMVTASTRSYNSFRTTNYNMNFRKKENLYVMLPVWTIAVKHNSKFYSFAMNGQTGLGVGKLPVSLKRMLVSFLGLGVLFSAITTLVGFLLRTVG